MVYLRQVIWEEGLMVTWNKVDVSPIKEVKNDKKMRKIKSVSWIRTRKNKINVQERTVNTKVATFQESLKVMLIIGQAFSLLPFDGVCSKNSSRVRFRKTSWKCAYAFISFLGQLFIMLMCMYEVITTDSSLKATTSIIFYITTLITIGMFFQAARDWPMLVQAVASTEELDPSIDKRLSYRCNITCAVVLTLALIEHILSLLSAFAAVDHCFPNMQIYEGFVKYFYPWVFDFIPYTPILGIWTQFLHFQATFIWNFSDLFVICISYYLTSRLEQVNKKLLAAQGKYLPENFWKSTREQYGRATQLVRKVDDVISGIVFMSFAINLFFICFVLYNTIENGFKGKVDCKSDSTESSKTPLKGYETTTYYFFSLVYLITRSIAVSLIAAQVNTASTVPAPVLYDVPSPVYCIEGYETTTYYFFSLVYLITRSIAVSLIAAQVNTASTVPAPVLYDVPSPVYCIEVQRFLDQVNGDNVALSGLQFFSVTRGLLLTVAGTIVTYELVMVQFNAPSTPQQTTPGVTTITPLLSNVTVT